MFLQVRWPNQQCQSTEGGWLVIQIALNLTRLISPIPAITHVVNTHVMHANGTAMKLTAYNNTTQCAKHALLSTICQCTGHQWTPVLPQTSGHKLTVFLDKIFSRTILLLWVSSLPFLWQMRHFWTLSGLPEMWSPWLLYTNAMNRDKTWEWVSE